MDCNCSGYQGNPQSWLDIYNCAPRNPLDLIARATLVGGFGNDAGVFTNSTTFATPPVSWVDLGPLPLTAAPTIAALGTDSQQNVADAQQYGFSHLSWNSSTLLAVPMRKVMFLKGGTQWAMSIPFSLGAVTASDIQLSFRDNAGTRGDFAGTIPVISWGTNLYTGSVQLVVTLKQTGDFMMMLRIINAVTSDWTAFEMEWRVR